MLLPFLSFYHIIGSVKHYFVKVNHNIGGNAFAGRTFPDKITIFLCKRYFFCAGICTVNKPGKFSIEGVNAFVPLLGLIPCPLFLRYFRFVYIDMFGSFKLTDKYNLPKNVILCNKETEVPLPKTQNSKNAVFKAAAAYSSDDLSL